MHVLIFIKLPIERFNESILSTNHNEYPIYFKIIQYICLINKSQWISKLNQKIHCIRWMKHIEYPTFAQILIETTNKKSFNHLIELK
jgi:hypothetical protein